MSDNIPQIEKEIDWFNQILEARIDIYFNHETKYKTISEIALPELGDNHYARVVSEFNMSFDERIILIISLIPHIQPHVLDTFFTHNKNFDRPFSEFGGWKGNTHGGFLPTGETAAFVLSGNDLNKRFEVVKMFEDEHFFHKAGILKLENNGENEPFLSGKLVISAEYLYKCTTGETHKPDYNIHFPAKLLNTPLNWEDLILESHVHDEIEQVMAWIKYESVILDKWKQRKYIRPGYRCLFHGPPGTGKTLSACLIGKKFGIDVYRIDLSMLVSKYIGETEKNLKNVFDQAENKKWILFFDEAESLFGKRTAASSANDRFANQETSYLLQRIEDFPGIVILATNMRTNMDEAFSRRFQSVIHFPMPHFEQRYQLWKNLMPEQIKLSSRIDLAQIAEEYEISGGAIVNIVRYCSLKVLNNKLKELTEKILAEGIRKEVEKEGKVMSFS